MSNGVEALEIRLAVPQSGKYNVTIWPSNSLSGYIPWRIENVCSRKSL